MSALTIELREKRYPAVGDQPAVSALADFHLEVAEGEFVCVFGPSGCGKTTLLHIVAGLDSDFDGSVRFANGAVPRLGYVFQTPRLLPWCTVAANVELVLDKAARERGAADDLIEAVGLADVRGAYPERLSLGMRRRVALARAFAVCPGLLLMDEPFVSLDEATAQRLRLLLLEVWQARPTTVLFVTHDLREAIRLADRIVFLSDAPGRVVADVAVELPRESRTNEAEIESFRKELMARESKALGTDDRPG